MQVLTHSIVQKLNKDSEFLDNEGFLKIQWEFSELFCKKILINIQFFVAQDEGRKNFVNFFSEWNFTFRINKTKFIWVQKEILRWKKKNPSNYFGSSLWEVNSFFLFWLYLLQKNSISSSRAAIVKRVRRAIENESWEIY